LRFSPKTDSTQIMRRTTKAAILVVPFCSRSLSYTQRPATALLSELHWLPVTSRITFKLACLTYKLLTTGRPAYLLTLLHQYTPTRTLRLTNQLFLEVPRFSTEFGKRSFSYLAPTIWNGLPLNIRLSPTFETFKRRQKTHLFK